MLNGVGICILIYLIVSLFLDNEGEPLACSIGYSSSFKGDYSHIKVKYTSWTVILSKLFGFMACICYLVLGTYIVYYKALIKVDTIVSVKKMTVYSLITFGVIGGLHVILVILCAAFAEFTGNDPAKSGVSDDDVDSKGSLGAGLSAIFELIFASLGACFFYVAYLLSKRTLETMLEFHDYLIDYRLTPRSRILRKHLPRMTMVIEEESDYDGASSMGGRSQIMSHSRIMSISQKSRNTTMSRRKKFVYRDEDAVNVASGDNVDLEIGSSSESDSDDS